jgi:hypothetical protein
MISPHEVFRFAALAGQLRRCSIVLFLHRAINYDAIP